MRATTELTTHFMLNVQLVGASELNDFLADDCATGSIEYWEAFDREEDLKMRGEMGLLDALDFDTVTFDSVVEDLSMELFAQDEADDREGSDGYGCACCGQSDLDDDWGDKLFQVGRSYYCKDCYEGALRRLHLTEEAVHKLNEKERKKRMDRHWKLRKALEIATKLRPDLNWQHYNRSIGI